MAASYTLQTLRTAILRRVDHETTGYFSTEELNLLINDSIQRHHDLMISVLGQEYSLAELIETVKAGEINHPLPSDFYKPIAIYAYTDIGWVPMLRFEFQDRLLQLTPMLPDWMPRLHLMGLASGSRQLKIDPPASVQFLIKHVYHTAAPVLDDDADVLTVPYPELLILDVAVKCQQRQRKDAAELIAERGQLRLDIESMHSPEDRANPPTVVDVTSRPYWPYSLKYDATLLPPANLECAKIRSKGAQSITNTTVTSVLLGATEFNNSTSMETVDTGGAALMIQSNAITVKKSGYYLIEWESAWGSGNGHKESEPTFDGADPLVPSTELILTGTELAGSKSILMKLTGRTAIGLHVFQNTGGAINVDSALSVTRLGDL